MARPLSLLALGATLLFAPCTWAAERATPDEAKAMAVKAAEYLKSVGPDKAFPELSAKDGPWHDRDLYVTVLDAKGVAVVQGNNPGLIGKSVIDLKDVDGKASAREMVAIADAGWVEYKWQNPLSKAVELESMRSASASLWSASATNRKGRTVYQSKLPPPGLNRSDGRTMKWLNNLSITGKSLISTLLGVLVLLVMAWLAISSFSEAQRADDEQGAATEVMSQARDAWIDLARGHAALYRAINLKSQNVEVALVRGAKNDAVQAIERAKKSLASLKTSGLSIDAQLVTKAAKAVGDYAGAALQAASFVEEDAFNATMFMTDAEQKFAGAQQDVSTLVTTAIELDGALDEQMTAMMHARLVTIAIGAGVAVLLLLVVSTLLSRVISRPIVAMTAAMRRLAGGDLAAEIPAVDRKDEVGQMAQAMVVFKANAQEARDLQAAAEKDHALKARRQAAMDRYTQDFGTSTAGVMASLGAVRRDDARDRGRDVGYGAPHARQRGACRRWRHHLGNQSRRGLGGGGADVVQHQRDQPAGRARDAGSERGGGACQRHRRQGGRHGGGGGSGRRRGATDHRYRGPHQSARVECHDRGGACRRGRQGLRRGRRRGKGAGDTDRQGDRGDRDADHGDPRHDR